jgi:hypothetical protein
MSGLLQPELVPGPLHRMSVHRRARESGRRNDWDRLRALVLAEASDTCAYCGAVWNSRQVCHEEWEYDDDNGVVTLTGFAVACQLCNFALDEPKPSRR